VPVLKPIRGIRINKSHPLARGLVGYWLLNEGTGSKVFDLSGNGNTGTLQGDTHFTSGRFGSALQFDGDGDNVNFGNAIFSTGGEISTEDFTIVLSVNTTEGAANQYVISKHVDSENRIYINIQTDYLLLYAEVLDTAILLFGNTGLGVDSGQFTHLAFVAPRGKTPAIYKNGVSQYLTHTLCNAGDVSNSGDFLIGGRSAYYFNGIVEYTMIFNRALSPSEISQLYREPFAMFSRPISPELMHTPATNVVNMTGSASAQASATGKVTFVGEPPGVLPQKMWLKEALFAGMTANAFKLGTTLSLGWFWMRLGGCSALYRGPQMNQIDFESILTVADQDAGFISPPGYVPHNSNSTCFYVVRRFNQCGDQEHTLAAAAKLSIDANGGLVKPQPNSIFSSRAEPVNGNKIRLTWFYSTLEQESAPTCFNVYYDGRTGQIDYENPIATVRYEGRKFYSFESDPLTAGRYLFAIRAKDVDGTENSSPALLRIHLQAGNPDTIDVLSVEAV